MLLGQAPFIVPLDGSLEAEAVRNTAIQLSRASQAPLSVHYVEGGESSRAVVAARKFEAYVGRVLQERTGDGCGWSRLALGGITDRVMRSVRHPVLVLPGRREGQPK